MNAETQAPAIDGTRKRGRGPAPFDPSIKRQHCVSVRLNSEERAMLDAARGRMQSGEYKPSPSASSLVLASGFMAAIRFSDNR